MHEENIMSLLECVKIDKYNVSCHFKCRVTNKTVISTVPFEPYEGKIEFTWQDIVFHPRKSWDRYYHTPITIYDAESKNTIVKKAFNKVSKYFRWDSEAQNFRYI